MVLSYIADRRGDYYSRFGETIWKYLFNLKACAPLDLAVSLEGIDSFEIKASGM